MDDNATIQVVKQRLLLSQRQKEIEKEIEKLKAELKIIKRQVWEKEQETFRLAGLLGENETTGKYYDDDEY